MEKEEIIAKIKDYIINTFNITSIELNINTRNNIKALLRKVRDNNNRVKLLRVKRNKIKEDIEDLEASMVGSQSFDGVQCGKNTGLKKNTTEIKYLQRLELKEELGKLLVETKLIEHSLEDNNKLVSDFIDLLSNANQRTIMKMTYFECMPNSEIASTLVYSIGAIDKERWRAIKELEKILKNE
ncbi:MAG: hypothetical protein K6E20_03775 [Acholeplasmatales bacterium]|nr:hypothetical protein [Acholeplasmatales bacterium]